MPFADERRVVPPPLAIVPGRRRRNPLLPQRVHRHDVVPDRLLAGLAVAKARFGDRFGSEPSDRLAGTIDPRPLHPVDAVAPNPSLGARAPLQVALLPFLLRK